MSTSLYWRPRNTEGEYLGYELKWALEALLGHDGSLSSDWIAVGEETLPFLRGVAAAGKPELKEQAQKLIDLINRHGEVEIATK